METLVGINDFWEEIFTWDLTNAKEKVPNTRARVSELN
jgi:hypothetical protein